MLMTQLCAQQMSLLRVSIILSIYHWIYVNQMVLNVDKTECMLLVTCQKLRDALKNISVGEDEYIMTPVSSHELLGIHVDNTLNWKTHITHLCSKIGSRLYVYI